jgi:hypothetical protein
VDVARGEMVGKQLDAMIQHRARKGDLDPDEREEILKASVGAYTARRREEMRAAWTSYHEGQAERHRATLRALNRASRGTGGEVSGSQTEKGDAA